MPKFNDFDLNDWKNLSDIETDSLWIIEKRDNSGKHSNFYHGNFVPQIPRQLIKRYTQKGDVVLDTFLGSGTTMYEAENQKRSCIGIELKQDLVNIVSNNMPLITENCFYQTVCGDCTTDNAYTEVANILKEHNKKSVQLVIMHPPYFDILKFSEAPADLSNSRDLQSFILSFGCAVEKAVNILDKNRYLAVVIGDKYSAGQWYPLGFYCMEEAQKHNLLLKSIIIKNMGGNRGKQNQESIWRYRALSSDYYIFKHEYIFLFKKVK